MSESIELLEGVSLSKNTAQLKQINLDINSAYSQWYICSVIHSDAKELYNTLKHQYSVINTTHEIPLEEYIKKKNVDNFERDIKKINLTSNVRDLELEGVLDKEAIQVSKSKIKKKSSESIHRFKENTLITFNRKLYLIALLLNIITLILQLTFTIVLAKEYYKIPSITTKDTEQIAMRIIAYCTMTLLVWMEYLNGRKKLNHSIYQGFLYISIRRRLISGLMSIMQMINSLICYFCCVWWLGETASVVDNAKTFGAICVMMEIDNWIGDFLIKYNRRLEIYTRGEVSLIWCSDKNDNKYLRCTELFEDIIFIIMALYNGYILYTTLIFSWSF